MDATIIMELRNMTGAGILDAKAALEATGGDIARAADELRKRGQAKAAKKADRETHEGCIGSYIHANGRIGVLVSVACETDFVARSDDFKHLVADIAMHIAASAPEYVSPEEIPADVIAKEREIAAAHAVGKSSDIVEKIIAGTLEKFVAERCLLKQEFVKDDTITVEQRVAHAVAKLGENIRVLKFSRFAL